ncbi:hypothetical protein D3C76_665130 [compost metagenome]
MAVAAAIVEAHAAQGMFDTTEQTAVEAAIGLGFEGEDAALHPCNPALFGACDAGQHFVTLPGVVGTVRLPAMQLAGGDIDPVQGLFGGVPHRALAGTVAGVDDQFAIHGRASWRAGVS